MEDNKNLVLCEIAYDDIDEQWYFTASLPNFYNETIENITADTREQAIEEMEFWVENYKIKNEEAIFQYKIA